MFRMCDLLGIIIIVTCFVCSHGCERVMAVDIFIHMFMYVYMNINSSFDRSQLTWRSLWNELHLKSLLVLFSKRLSEDSNSLCEPG